MLEYSDSQFEWFVKAYQGWLETASEEDIQKCNKRLEILLSKGYSKIVESQHDRKKEKAADIYKRLHAMELRDTPAEDSYFGNEGQI